VVRDADIAIAVNRELDEAAGSELVGQLAMEAQAFTNDGDIASVYSWMKAHVLYVRDSQREDRFEFAPGYDRSNEPVEMAAAYYKGATLMGDCEDFAALCTALYRWLGLDAHVVLLDFHGRGWEHAVCEVASGPLGRSVMVDASTGDVPLGYPEGFVNRMVIR